MSSARTPSALGPIAAAALWLIGSGGTSWAAPPESKQIIVRDFMFQPMSLTIPAGASVTWTNRDDEPHSVKSDTALFASGALDTNESYSFRFDKPGAYHFTCSIHPRMVGTIIVQ